MIIYFASNCGVPKTGFFVLKSKGGARLHSYVYQVKKGVPVSELKVAMDYIYGITPKGLPK